MPKLKTKTKEVASEYSIKKMIIIASAIAIVILIVLLNQNSGKDVDINQGNENKIYCTDEQKSATICTMEYMAVCGDDGKTYGNKCSACASNNIDYYMIGECQYNDDINYLTLNKWSLSKINNEDIGESSANLMFNTTSDMISGNAGCNQMFGSFSVDNDIISFGQIGSTLMYCEGFMEIEMEYISLLSMKSYNWKINNDILIFYTDESSILEFRKL